MWADSETCVKLFQALAYAHCVALEGNQNVVWTDDANLYCWVNLKHKRFHESE